MANQCHLACIMIRYSSCPSHPKGQDDVELLVTRISLIAHRTLSRTSLFLTLGPCLQEKDIESMWPADKDSKWKRFLCSERLNLTRNTGICSKRGNNHCSWASEMASFKKRKRKKRAGPVALCLYTAHKMLQSTPSGSHEDITAWFCGLSRGAILSQDQIKSVIFTLIFSISVLRLG